MNEYKNISEHLQGASASLEMAMQELEGLEGVASTYLEAMWTQLATFQWRIDGYMKDLEPLLAETEV
jgi:hypothetical protein